MDNNNPRSYPDDFDNDEKPDYKTDEELEREVSIAVAKNKFFSLFGFFKNPFFLLAILVLLISGIAFFKPGIINFAVDAVLNRNAAGADLDAHEIPRKITKTIEYNVTVNETIEKNISFEKYLREPEIYYKTNASLIGFLKEELIQKPEMERVWVSRKYIVDDYENRIELVNLNPQQDVNFLPGRKTFFIYNVSGVLDYAYEGLKLKANNLTAGEREKIVVFRNITMTKTIEVDEEQI